MKAEDWPRVEELFHHASQLEVAERAAYLARECAGDEGLRREVESLVSAFESNHSFMERPVLDDGLRLFSSEPPGSLAGSTLGHYKVLRLIGQGGMGEVYLAEDSLLERPVALKFITPGLVGDEWARERLMKEARAVAKLEHQNICAVYAVDEIGGRDFIVMPYVEGEPLDALLRRERLSLERALELAEQIVAALSAAHSRGVIHRDVKPQNIVVTSAGQAKVLDFGIAKLIQQKQGAETAAQAPTQMTLVTGALGTYAYMSPEQVRGEELDHRSDIFSFGIVLYEMLGGRNPFLREGSTETVAAIITEDPPPLSYLPLALAEGLERVARKCLEKEPARRYATAEQLLHDLRGLHGDRRKAATTPPPILRPRFPALRRHARALAASALAFLLLLSTLAAYAYLKMSKVHTLAVLPITNQSDDRQADYLGEGLTRNLSDKFSYLPRLRLRLPSSAPRGPGSPEDLARIGRELKADAVLSGQIVKQGDSLQLRLGLLNVGDAAQVWEGAFDLDAADLFALQDDVTRQVAAGLGLWLVGDERGLLTRRQTDSEEALKLYMRGRYAWTLRRTRENVQEAIRLFEQAKELDPSFAKAYTGLADCYALTANVLYGPIPTGEAMEKARYNARQALELDDSLAEAHTSMGIVRLRFDWDWIEAEREFKRAIELDPEYAPARFWYTGLLAARGRFDEAIRESEAARAFDPYSSAADINYARALYYARRPGESEAYLRQKIEEKPGVAPLQHMLGYVLLQQGRIDEAIAVFEKLPAERRVYSAAAIGYSYGRAGREGDALRMIGELDEIARGGVYVPPFEKALVYIGMNRRDEAFALLNESYDLRMPNLTHLAVEPAFEVIRDDPRFADLTRRLKLTP